jgi:hypothetical protein
MADSILDIETGASIWTRSPEWSGEVEWSFPLSQIIIGFPGTVQNIFSDAVRVPLSYEFKYINSTKAQEYELIEFFNTMEGRLRRFYAPTWTRLLTLAADATSGGYYIRVNNVFITGLINSSTYPQYIRILMENGDWIVRRIESASIISNTIEQIRLVSPLDRNLSTLSPPVLIDLFLNCRFDIDILEINYITDSVSTVTVRITELVNEYSPLMEPQ